MQNPLTWSGKDIRIPAPRISGIDYRIDDVSETLIIIQHRLTPRDPIYGQLDPINVDLVYGIACWIELGCADWQFWLYVNFGGVWYESMLSFGNDLIFRWSDLEITTDVPRSYVSF
jgi:hypothetical protein